MDNYIGKQIQRTNRNLLITGVIFIGICLGLAAWKMNVFYNAFKGPFSIQFHELTANNLKNYQAGSAKHFFLTFEIPNQQLDVSFFTYKSKSHDGLYFIAHLPSSNEIFLIRTSLKKEEAQKLYHENKPLLVKGEFIKTPSSVESRFQNKNKAHLSPLMFDATHFQWPIFAGFACGSFFFILGIWCMITAIKRGNHPWKHPLAKTVSTFGEFEKISNYIEEELQQAHGVFQLKSMLITPSWLLQPSLYGLKVLFLEDVAWMYEQIVQNRTNGIPTGKNYKAILWTRHGKSIELDCGKGQASEIMIAILQRVPWIFVGYNEQLKTLWSSHRAQFIADLDERKRQIMPPVSEPQTTHSP